MLTDARMFWFHAKQMARNTYFVQLLITSTLGMVALQALAARNPDAIIAGTGGLGWLRAGMLGTWTMCGVAVGLLGYQQFQGTFTHLIRSPHQVFRALFPVVGAASVFGLGAFPMAALSAIILRQPLVFGNIGALIIAGLIFWLACLALSSVLGMAFVLTPNAITYEGLIGIPLVLVSGIFGTFDWIPSGVLAAARILPTRGAVELLFNATSGAPLNWILVAITIASSLTWLAVAAWIVHIVIKRLTKTGKSGAL